MIHTFLPEEIVFIKKSALRMVTENALFNAENLTVVNYFSFIIEIRNLLPEYFKLYQA